MRLNQTINQQILTAKQTGVLAFCVWFFVAFPLPAQTTGHYPHRNITTKDGLASSTVYSCFKDSRNFMWFATESGVNRYDGTIMETFNLDNGLTDVEVFNLFEDSKGRIWFYTYNGIPCFYSEGKIHNPYNDSLLRHVRMQGYIRKVLEDQEKNIWIITRTDEMLCLNPGGTVRHLAIPARIIDGYIDQRGNMLVLDAKGVIYHIQKGALVPVHTIAGGTGRYVWYRNNKLYFSNPAGLSCYDGKTETVITRDPKFSVLNVFDVNVNAEGNLWVGTDNGVYELDGKTGRELHHMIKNEPVSSIVEDHEHNYWVSTMEKGVYFFPSYWESLVSFNRSNLLLSDKVKCVTQYKDNLLVGFGDGTIQQLDSVPKYVHLNTQSMGDRNRIRNMVARQDTLFIITDKTFAVTQYQQNQWKVIYSEGMPCKDIAFAPDHSILVATSSGVVRYVYDAQKHSYTSRSLVRMFQVSAVCAGNEPRAWFSMNEHLYELNYTNATYKEIILPIRSRISDLVIAANGSLVISTAGEGVFVMREGKVLAHITEKNGLSSTICRSLVLGNKDDFWVTTYKGLDHLQPMFDTAFAVRSYGAEIGIPDNGLECFMQLDDAHILVGSDDGLLAIDLQKIPGQAHKPLLYLTSVESAGHLQNTSDMIQLPYLRANLSVTFRGVTYSEKNHLVYAYRLLRADKPADTLWSETDNNIISFFSLDGGNYLLEVKCRNNNSNWSKIQSLPIVVKEPFWKNIYFMLALLLFVLASGLLVLRRSLKSARRVQDRLERKVYERTRELSEAYNKQEAIHKEKDDFIHMVAHDLRNPLTSILFSAEMISEDLKKSGNSDTTQYLEIIRTGAERMKMLISNLLDMSLLERGQMKINIETVYPEQICRTVAGDYQAKAASKQMNLVYRNEAPAQGVQTDKSALIQIIDNLVSNAVKYNTPGKNIQVLVSKENNHLVIRIADEGPGLSEDDQKKLYTKFGRLQPRPTGGEDSTGIGLYIVKKLADMLGAGLSFESKLGVGTTFILKLPTP